MIENLFPNKNPIDEVTVKDLIYVAQKLQASIDALQQELQLLQSQLQAFQSSVQDLLDNALVAGQ